jgi:phosphopantetheinyl transferase (holo-ACP synthase)
MELMKNEKEQITKNEVFDKPVINARSKQIGKNEPPIHKRFTKLLARKEAKIKALKEQREKEMIDRDPENFNPTFKPELNATSRVFAALKQERIGPMSLYDKDQ